MDRGLARRSWHCGNGARIAERELREPGIGVDRRLRLFLGRLGLLLALGFDNGFVFRGQDFRATQIFVGVDVPLLLGLVFAGAFLARGFGYILGGPGTALRSAKNRQEQRAIVNPQRRGWRRETRLCTWGLLELEEVSDCHLPTDFGGTSDSEILLERLARCYRNFVGKKY